MPVQINKTAELITGYSLQERIGSGGYGEVWRAEAPGGLLKAIKFIYGRFDEERASTELKALHRIKEVRHPFLLSLERIEVIDGQLVIVTELADVSLNERFEACKAEGLPGIPREELLLYLHDAADALDYMSKHFQLQHLDIKPENLLIVGGRVKVADFGLVKDVQDVTVSLMGGMTPVYAAPEVFNGHPSLHSDQYSLAIVYQEMLTGVLPFPGKTPAQLTSQHLHGKPRLTPLPATDRLIVGRALDKDSQKRFTNCRALIEALQNVKTLQNAEKSEPHASSTPPSPPENASARKIYRTVTLSNMEPSCDTEAESYRQPPPQNFAATQIPKSPARVGEGEAPAEPSGTPESDDSALARQEPRPPDSGSAQEEPRSPRLSESGIDASAREKINTINSLGHSQEADLPLAPPPAEFENLSAWKEPFNEVKLRPTFVIGAGGMAARVLRQLKRRWHENFDETEELPIFEALSFDTDPLTSARMPTTDSACRNLLTELLPLKKPEDYREKGDQLMRWLGHRWLYNIPRSLRTEGLRPLGRLALIDNAEQAKARICRVLKEITAPASLEAAAEQTKLPIDGPSPLVYLIAAISGGTGSGMILDLAYAVRHALAQEGIASARICGILLHGTSRHAAEKKLAIANSYACLRELNAYEHRYPGESVWDMAAEKDGRLPFDDTYFIHLGDDLSEDEMNASTEKIAEYLALDTTTACRGFFERCRTVPAAEESSSLQKGNLRSMGLSRLGFTPADIPAADIESLCHSLVEHWLQSPTDVVPRSLSAKTSSPASAPRAAAAPAKADKPQPSSTLKAVLDCDALAVKIEELVHELVYASDENALLETLDKSCQISVPSEAETTANRAQQTLDVLYTTVQSLVEKSSFSTAGEDDSVLLPLRKLAAAEGAALKTRVLQQCNDSEGGLGTISKIIEEVLHFLHEQESDAFQRQERLQEIIAHAELLLPSESAEDKKSWLGRLFNSRKSSSSAPRWKDYARWRLELVVLHGQRQLWRTLQECMNSLKRQLREMREELQAISQAFQHTNRRSESLEANEVSAFHALLRNAWEELFGKHRRVLAGKLERRMRRGLIADYLSTEETARTEKLTPKARVESLRRAVRQELSHLLQEIDLAGLVLSFEKHPDNAASALQATLEQAQSPQYSKYGGAQRLLLACRRGEVLDNLKQKVESTLPITPCIAHTSSHEIVFCYEVEQIPLRRIAAQLLENYDDCRAIAAKLSARTDISLPRDF